MDFFIILDEMKATDPDNYKAFRSRFLGWRRKQHFIQRKGKDKKQKKHKNKEKKNKKD